MLETVLMVITLIGIFLMIKNPMNLYAYDVGFIGILGNIVASNLGI